MTNTNVTEITDWKPGHLRKGRRRINNAGLSLIRAFEGLSLKSYRCPAGKWTIGYGHTQTATPNQTITAIRAGELLQSDLSLFEQGVAMLVKVPLNDNQFAALVSLAFNIGLSSFSRSSLISKLNTGQYDKVPFEIRRWRFSGGQELPGLKRRREAEARLFLRQSTHTTPLAEVTDSSKEQSAQEDITP